jgi:signal transduction histidine kinase
MPEPLDVLVVDDEPKIRQILSQILASQGCTVRVAGDGLDALEQFKRQPSDIVITDLKMPKFSGSELLRELKRLDPLLNVVVITAYPSVDGAVEAMKQGACDFLTKPFELVQIQAILYRCRQRVTMSRQLRTSGEGLLKLEELNRRLAELNDLKSQFLAVLSHEINTPLCLMSEWIYLLADRSLGELSADQQQAVAVLIGAYERLHILLQQLIDLMHGQTVVLQRQTVDVRDLLRQAVGVVSSKAEVRSVTVTAKLAEGPMALDADRPRLAAAFEYLLDNAVKFNRESGRVDVELSGTPDAVQVKIQDSGIGIPPEEIEKVFAPFYQVDRGLNRVYGGAGIGLTLARRYVELHGGNLQLSSEPGSGTTVVVQLPRPSATVTLPNLSSSAF